MSQKTTCLLRYGGRRRKEKREYRRAAIWLFLIAFFLLLGAHPVDKLAASASVSEKVTREVMGVVPISREVEMRPEMIPAVEPEAILVADVGSVPDSPPGMVPDQEVFIFDGKEIIVPDVPPDALNDKNVIDDGFDGKTIIEDYVEPADGEELWEWGGVPSFPSFDFALWWGRPPGVGMIGGSASGSPGSGTQDRPDEEPPPEPEVKEAISSGPTLPEGYASIPEPGVVGLMTFAGMFLIFRRRRKSQ